MKCSEGNLNTVYISLSVYYVYYILPMTHTSLAKILLSDVQWTVQVRAVSLYQSC